MISPVLASTTSSAGVRPRMRSPSEAMTAPPWTIARMSSAVLGAAILLDDDAILRHVDQTAGQVARVRRLERRVREALAGAVGRVEIFKDGQAFLEVRDDRRLDDLARRLGHQAAHAGELLHLRLRTAGAGMGHHVDRVDRRLPAVLVLRLAPGSSSIIAFATWSPQRLQASITLLYFSCWVIRPS